jgi:protein TonB
MAAETLDEPVSVNAPNDRLVAISSLTRTKYYAPKYPRVAQRRNLSGWVSIEFTVAVDGSVRDVEALEAEPAEIFDNAAIRAVERWKFEPIFENGVAVEKRAGVRMMFALE